MPQPPPPRNAAVGTGSGGGGDAFFNDFSQPPTAAASVRQRVGGPPLQTRPPGGSTYSAQPPQTTRLPVTSTTTGRGQSHLVRNPTKPQPPPNQQRPLPPKQQQQPPPPITYPQQQQPNPSYSSSEIQPLPQTSNSYYGNTTGSTVATTVAPVAQPMYEESQSNDWYTPSATDTSNMVSSNNNYGMVQQQPLQYSQPSMLSTTTTTTMSTPYNTNPYIHPAASSSSYLNGTMDTSGRDTTSYPSIPQTFIPQPQQQSLYSNNNNNVSTVGDLTDDNNYINNEPPLLEEIGVNWEHIMMKTKAVVIPFRRFQKHSALADPSIIVEDADLAGPLAYALLLGGELLMTGKLQFGYIYGFGLFGCLAMTLILNLMSPTSISFWTVTSILGYALIPVNILAAIKIVLFSFGTLVQILALITVVWSTTASTRLLEIGFGLTDQRYLLAYPIALLYSAFVLITIF